MDRRGPARIGNQARYRKRRKENDMRFQTMMHNGVEIHLRSNAAGTPYVSFYVGTAYHGLFYFSKPTPEEAMRKFALACAELIATHLPTP